LKILTFSTLYPHAGRLSHGIFVETRLRHLVASGEVQSRVVAPVPWFPSRHPRFGEYAAHAAAPRQECRHGIQILHPRYPVLPKIGMTVAPILLALSLKTVFERVLEQYPFDLIDAHYFYPDGVAAILLGRRFGKPVVITARGTDVNLIPQYRLPRAMIRRAAGQAAAIIAVADALKRDLVQIGVPGERIEVLRNGVDLKLFRPIEREPVRRKLGMRRMTLLSVGHLIPRKGHDLVIQALQRLAETDLIVIGDGPEREALEALAMELGVRDRVRFVGALVQEELRNYYGAADALVLASSREGWANVLLESMACGTPVVASNIGGTPEVVSAPEGGMLMTERTANGIVQAVQRLFACHPDRSATRRYAERFSWEATTAGQMELFARILRVQAAGSLKNGLSTGI
jgi:teichuronic acid biosynthesis glycosyltransferase TuaC